MDPEVILLDEPTSALDPTMVGEVQAVCEYSSQTDLAEWTNSFDEGAELCNRLNLIVKQV